MTSDKWRVVIVKSILIRYTNSKYKDDYLRGDLYLSSLSSFWKLPMGMSAAEYQDALAKREILQDDFSEGIGKQIPSNKVPLFISSDFKGHIVHDVRYRIEAYGYCNLLCFYRVDYEDRPLIEKRY